jgi:glutamate--cysteine ligase
LDSAPPDAPLVGLDDLRLVVADSLRPLPGAPAGPGAVGVEVEQFAVHVDGRGGPGRRLDVDGLTALLDDHPALEAEPPSATALTGWRVPQGGRLVPEPGGQVEYAGPPHPTVAAALDAAGTAIREVATFAETRGVALVSAGLDPFDPHGTARQGLRCPRYPAMHDYLARRSPHGHVMMTGSASLQVNLDLGPDPEVGARRWAAAMAVAPLATATFACSPVPGAVSGRAVVWQWTDPTRTGIPAAFVAGDDDPVEVISRFAWDADVLLVNRGSGWQPGEPGLSFARWVADGHAEHGRPTRADAAYHLTTLFPEVRARGTLEIRSVDALPQRWRAVPVVLYAALLYDDRARELASDLMAVHRRRLPALLQRAAHLGVADPELCALSVEVWTAAAEAARRLPEGYVHAADLSRCEAYLDRFTLRGRAPADELRERLAHGAAEALAWGREPVGSVQLC